MPDQPSADPVWRQGYEAAVEDLERLARLLPGAETGAGSQHGPGVDCLYQAINHLRARLAGTSGTVRTQPAGEPQREWTEG